MTLGDLTPRIQALCDDPDGTYITPEYISNHAQQQYERLVNRLRAETGSEFDYNIALLPNVTQGLPNLSQYQQTGQPLASLITPSIIEWKLPGQNDTYYRRANGPLDYPQDLPDAGIPALDSWAWIRRNVLVSKTSTALDLRITGQFLFDPLLDQDSAIELDLTCNVVIVYMIALAIAKARGNPAWVVSYQADTDETFDDLKIALVKADQGKTRRVARMMRGRNQGGSSGPFYTQP